MLVEKRYRNVFLYFFRVDLEFSKKLCSLFFFLLSLKKVATVELGIYYLLHS